MAGGARPGVTLGSAARAPHPYQRAVWIAARGHTVPGIAGRLGAPFSGSGWLPAGPPVVQRLGAWASAAVVVSLAASGAYLLVGCGRAWRGRRPVEPRARFWTLATVCDGPALSIAAVPVTRSILSASPHAVAAAAIGGQAFVLQPSDLSA